VRSTLPRGPFFSAAEVTGDAIPLDGGEFNAISLFGWVPLPLTGEPPDWHRNVLTGKRAGNAQLDWWLIPDFDEAVGDIKGIWEPSRFAWAIPLARRARGGDLQALDRLNAWIDNWCDANPAYRGHNWKCGQESSFRVMHLAMASVILNGEGHPLPGLLRLVEAHLRRIAPTKSYAIGQDNNHGTSEASALFVGGSMLARAGVQAGRAWIEEGRRLLENRVSRLVMPDGTFSQYSVNYHRLLLDTLSITELWRRRVGEEKFSEEWYERAKAATEWLRALTDPVTGQGPNIGANDGARLLPIGSGQATDLRPAVRLASVLFCGQAAFRQSPEADATLAVLGLEELPESRPAETNRLFDDGGFARLGVANASAVLRYPRFRFRPSHADALHVDLWVGGENLLRDGGTFSYNADEEWLRYFPGTESHNTAQFDGRDQMPRLSRFLFGSWLRADHVSTVREEQRSTSFSAGYRDSHGAVHHRTIVLRPGSLEVRDELSGKFENAVIRWRLIPGPWEMNSSGASDGQRTIRVESGQVVSRKEIVRGWESRLYGEKTPIPVLEVEVTKPAIVDTIISWA
jgi:hypothetical protein